LECVVSFAWQGKQKPWETGIENNSCSKWVLYEDVKKSRHPPIKGPTIRKSGKKDHHLLKTNMLK